jgi:hypothetical protein
MESGYWGEDDRKIAFFACLLATPFRAPQPEDRAIACYNRETSLCC